MGWVEEAHAVPGRGLEGDCYFWGSGMFSGSPDTASTPAKRGATWSHGAWT